MSHMGKMLTGSGLGDLIRERIAADPALSLSGLVRAGIPSSTLYRKFDGVGSFTLDELIVIATYLDTTPGELITATEQRLAGVA